MPITALPTETVRSIGSIQALTDPCSLVKELIDNSLDAQASAIFIEISLNTLDVVQVKDNGHGIFPGDRNLVCRRNHTSKIRCFDDIENIGGKSLGFRGEALASAVEMSGGIIVSTRIEGETTAVKLTFNRQGEIEKEMRISQPIGTTVRIIDFLKNLPVRRQTAKKVSGKSTIKIKRLLHAYAYARPSVRFSLKVLKAKNDKSNWTYAPANGDTVLDAAIKIDGKRLADQCQWKMWTSTKDDGRIAPEQTDEEIQGGKYIIEALVPVYNYDPSVVNNLSQYITIDSRPVSSSRGTFKKFSSLYRSYVGSGSLVEHVNAVKDPFLCMNLVCPSKSYDANVEPAKDDVLFSNADMVLTMFESFLKSVYGELPRTSTVSTQSRASVPNLRNFDLLLARKRTPSVPVIDKRVLNAEDADKGELSLTTSHSLQPMMPCQTNLIQDHEEPALEGKRLSVNEHSVRSPPATDSQNIDDQHAAERRRGWQHSMYGVDEEGMCNPRSPDSLHHDTGQQQGSQVSDEEDSLRDARVSNPWVFAKLNAPVRQSNLEKKIEPNLKSNDQLLTPGRQIGEVAAATAREVQETTQKADIFRFGLPTPKHTQGYPAPRRASSSPDPFPFPQKVWAKVANEYASRKHTIPKDFSNEPGALDAWLQKPATCRSATTFAALDSDLHDSNESAEILARDFVSARALPVGTSLSAIPEKKGTRNSLRPVLHKQQGTNANKPFVSPVNNPERVWFEIEPSRAGKNHPSRTKSVADSTAALTSARPDSEDRESIAQTIPPFSSVHPDLATTMEYETRKQAALQHWKANQRRSDKAKGLANNPQVELSRPPDTISPHKNRYDQAVAALHSTDDNEIEMSAHLSAFEPGDPRVHLIRPGRAPRNSSSTGAPKRRKTRMLPLESVQDDSTARDLVLAIDVKISKISDLLTASKVKGSFYDDYISSGTYQDAFSSCTIEEICIWEAKINGLTQNIYGNEGSGGGDRSAGLRVDLCACLRAHQGLYS